MAFCTECGGQVADGATFCGNCGARLGGAAPAPTAPPPEAYQAEPLDYSIEGDNLQIVRVRLKPGQDVIAEAGKMVYKRNVDWQTQMTGKGIGEKLFGALKRKMTGESLFVTHFRTSSGGEVGFAGDFPGRIQAFDLKQDESVLVQRDGFVAAEASVKLDIAFTKKIGAGLFGGEGFILQRLTGPGTAFIHGGGDFVEFDLDPGEALQIDTGCVVAFDSTVDYDVQFAGGIATSIFGGEGLFLATLRGPGRAYIQTMTLSKLRRELGGGLGAKKGGGEQHGLDTIAGLFGSSD